MDRHARDLPLASIRENIRTRVLDKMKKIDIANCPPKSVIGSSQRPHETTTASVLEHIRHVATNPESTPDEVYSAWVGIIGDQALKTHLRASLCVHPNADLRLMHDVYRRHPELIDIMEASLPSRAKTILLKALGDHQFLSTQRANIILSSQIASLIDFRRFTADEISTILRSAPISTRLKIRSNKTFAALFETTSFPSNVPPHTP
jgi:hypothetical protein